MSRTDTCTTELLQAWQSGDAGATDAINQQIYATLKQIARQHAPQAGAAHAMSATSVVNETVVRLLEGNVDCSTRAHFYALATLRIRAVLVDHARRRQADKRGGGLVFVTLGEAGDVSTEEEFLALHEALLNLEHDDPRTSRVLELTYFGGLSAREVSEAIDVSVSTVERDLAFGRVWLKAALER